MATAVLSDSDGVLKQTGPRFTANTGRSRRMLVMCQGTWPGTREPWWRHKLSMGFPVRLLETVGFYSLEMRKALIKH